MSSSKLSVTYPDSDCGVDGLESAQIGGYHTTVAFNGHRGDGHDGRKIVEGRKVVVVLKRKKNQNSIKRRFDSTDFRDLQ